MSRYRMEAILPHTHAERVVVEEEEQSPPPPLLEPFSVACAKDTIQYNRLDSDGLFNLQLFNSVCIPESNARTMRFVFASAQQGAYTCNVTPTGQLSILQYHAVPPAYDTASALLPPSDGDLDAFHAASIYTITHDYIQTSTPARYIHIGLSFVPCGILFIPLWVGESGMRTLLTHFYEQKLPVAKTEALLTVRLLNGGSSIRHVVPRQHEKHERLLPPSPQRQPTQTPLLLRR
jgi:hypothetical protein